MNTTTLESIAGYLSSGHAWDIFPLRRWAAAKKAKQKPTRREECHPKHTPREGRKARDINIRPPPRTSSAWIPAPTHTNHRGDKACDMSIDDGDEQDGPPPSADAGGTDEEKEKMWRLD